MSRNTLSFKLKVSPGHTYQSLNAALALAKNNKRLSLVAIVRKCNINEPRVTSSLVLFSYVALAVFISNFFTSKFKIT